MLLKVELGLGHAKEHPTCDATFGFSKSGRQGGAPDTHPFSIDTETVVTFALHRLKRSILSTPGNHLSHLGFFGEL